MDDNKTVNRVCISGILQARGALRYTPAGLPVVELALAHSARLMEAERLRQVDCLVPCVALGRPALLLKDAPLGGEISLTGFLAAKSARGCALMLHVNDVEFLSR